MSSRIGWVFRAFFGLLLLVTALGKLLDNRGFAEVLGTYQLGIPEPLLLPMALAVSLVELGMAVFIFWGLWLRHMAVLTILMHATYTAMATLTNLRGLDLENCGCFGVFWARPMTWSTVLEDAVLTLLAVGFYFSVASSGRRASVRPASPPEAEHRHGGAIEQQS